MKILKNLNWVYEVVNEYANIDIINKESIIYGGIIRDILAKKKPEGDIDVATLTTNLLHQMNYLSKSCKWKKIQKSIETLILDNEKYKSHVDDIKSKLDLNSIHEYKNNNKILQLIVTENITKLICNVDFICCGIGMDYNGNIIEYLDGAYNDCVNHKLRLNTNHSRPNILITKFKRRLTKLIKRGWEPCNISKDRKILYKNIYKKRSKKKQLDKIIYTQPHNMKNIHTNKKINTLKTLSKYNII